MSLYLVSTPIGNLEDITLRALSVLKQVDLIACEDTRHTRKLLDHFGIRKPSISYHEHNEQERAAELTRRLAQGDSIAIVSDAGTPGISDPAYRIVRAAIEQGIDVVPIPGPAALVAGLVASGLPTDSFYFGGFLPSRKMARRSRFEQLRGEPATLVFYEAPHRIREALLDAEEVLGDREASLARELTKLHEQFLRGRISEIRSQLEARQPRGEMTLVIAGCGDDNSFSTDKPVGLSLADQIDQLIEQEGLSRTDALKAAARSRRISRREAYQMLLEEREDEDDIEIEED